MSIREEILAEAISGTGCTPEWAALQTVRLYRRNIADGQQHEVALAAARQEMEEIAAEALRLRREAVWREHIAPWCVVVLGALACVGWWYLWE